MLAKPLEPILMKTTFARSLITMTFLLGALTRFTSEAEGQGGIPLWTNRYHGVSSGRNGASGIAVDNLGNVFVTGQSMGGTNYDFATVAYSSAGLPLWTNRYPAQVPYFIKPNIAVDRNGNVFVTGPCPDIANSNTDDLVTVGYSGAGVALWTNRFPQADQTSRPGIAVDSNGNVFIAGAAINGSSNLEYAVVAYSNAGVPLWTNRYHGPGHDDEYALAVATDSSGNVFVSGKTGGITNAATLGYSNAGTPLWTNYFNGSFLSIAVGTSGHVFVTGYIPSVVNTTDYATVAYSNSGLPLWTNIYIAPGNGYTIAEAAAVDNNDNVFVTGQAGTGNWIYGTLAYSASGIPLWTNFYSGPINNDLGLAIAVDIAGNVFATGTSGTANGQAFGTIAYSGAGVPLWTNRYQAISTGLDGGQAITVDTAGSVYVTGVSQGTNGDQAYATIKYSSSIQPHLAIQKANNQAVLNWTNAGFVLQSAHAITGTFTNIPGAASPYTNSTAGTEQYFQLTAP
jgi:hypothetical protein